MENYAEIRKAAWKEIMRRRAEKATQEAEEAVKDETKLRTFHSVEELMEALRAGDDE